ncbi:MAG: hypothetical protein V3W06_08290, partial [Acidimicrobiia bacterium]
MSIVNAVVIVLRAFLMPRPAIAAENLGLRQQLAVLHQSVRRPRLRQRDRVPLWWDVWEEPARIDEHGVSARGLNRRHPSFFKALGQVAHRGMSIL